MPQQRYSIRDLENFTEIKAHTIRIWEQRYNLLVPSRTSTNVRYYSEDDFKKILNIKLLYHNGYKISKIAALSDAEIIKTAKSYILDSGADNREKEINDLTLLILDFESGKIKEFLYDQLHQSDLITVYIEVIIPILYKLGQLWQVNSIEIVHEHFFSYVYREFIMERINSLPDPLPNAEKAVMFLHDSEEHEFSILMYYYLLKEAGYNCLYFGQKVPIDEMENVQQLVKPKFVISTFTAKISQKTFQKINSILVKMSIVSKILVSGVELKRFDFKSTDSIHYLNSIEDLKALIKD